MRSYLNVLHLLLHLVSVGYCRLCVAVTNACGCTYFYSCVSQLLGAAWFVIIARSSVVRSVKHTFWIAYGCSQYFIKGIGFFGALLSVSPLDGLWTILRAIEAILMSHDLREGYNDAQSA
ncbi:unnamed protein product [Ixodes pacificus]